MKEVVEVKDGRRMRVGDGLDLADSSNHRA